MQPTTPRTLWAQPAIFRTRSGGRLRTCGVVLYGNSLPAALSGIPSGDLHALATHEPSATASGKVVVLMPDGVHVLQSHPTRALAPVRCGNATAVAPVAVGKEHLVFPIFGPNGASCIVTSRSLNGYVTQTWTTKGTQIEASTWRGRRVARLDLLNRYAIVEGVLPRGVDPEFARRELTGGGLDGKLAIVTPEFVEFYVAGGRHGAAPQTGLASLAIASEHCSWLGALLPDRQVKFLAPEGLQRTSLPLVAVQGDGRLSIDLPPVSVELTPLYPRLETAA